MNEDDKSCFVCSEVGHWAKDCQHRKGKKVNQEKNTKSLNVNIGTLELELLGMVIYLLFFCEPVYQLVD